MPSPISHDLPRRSSLLRSPRRWIAFALAFGAVTLFFALLPASPAPGEAEIPAGTGRWVSVLPPVFAVAAAFCFRNVVFALLGAFLLGSFLHFGPNPIVTLPAAGREFLLANLFGQFNLAIFGFLFALVGMIHVTYRSGGIGGLVALSQGLVRGRRSTMGATALSGLIIFFDDYSNTVVVGQTMRGLADKWKVSREKLAYLVDSTTAPVACVALLSTWIAFEVYLLGAAAARAGIETGGYTLFLQMLPYRFYCWGTLMFVALVAATGRDFGPMLKAERAARAPRPDGESGGSLPAVGPPLFAALPLATVLLGILGGIVLVGRARLLAADQPFAWGDAASWRAAFGIAVYDPARPDGPGVVAILFCAALAGGVVAVALPVLSGHLTLRGALGAYAGAFIALRVALFILLMAWSMKSICEALGTDWYLVSLLSGHLAPEWLPLAIFVVGAAMSFAMGTSFGTMGVLIPVMLPLAATLTAGHPHAATLFLLSAAAVLDGAIFGDHCSPISDTTVLSSISSGCDHLAHVSTQLAYALVTMALASLTGYILTALAGTGTWVFWIAFPIAAWGILRFFGKTP
ncbi:Na+/H+ antiporter NhaC family protein [soil metagenome]